MKAFRTGIRTALFFFIFSGCATVQTDKEWTRLESIVRRQTGQDLLWEQSEEDQVAIREEVDKLLMDGLTREKAVRIALLNNRRLQSAFEEIGVSKSDLVQAGLFTNPSLGALFRFPLGGGRTNIEAGGAFGISDLWQIPLRKKVAAAQMEAALLQLSHMVLETAAEAKRSYDEVYYLKLAIKERETLLRQFKEISDEVKKRRDFGFANDLDIYLSEVMAAEAEVELAQVESQLVMARAHLNRVLGLRPEQREYKIVSETKKELPAVPEMEDALRCALNNRFDIQMARFRISQAERELKLEKMRILKHVNLEVSYEKEVEGEEVLGPGVDIQLPIFDQNQAQIAKAQYRLCQAHKNLQTLEGKVTEELMRDLERIKFHRTKARLIREKIIPLYEKGLNYTEEWLKSMQLNRLLLLDTQKGLLQAQRTYVDVLLDLNQALVDLEYDLGGKLP